jgi:hypothetical protein
VSGAGQVSTGCYLYGIATADLTLPDDLNGIDGQAVGVVPLKGVAAVTSPLDVERIIARRADLIAHSRVLDAVAATGPVIPVRFGSVMHDHSELLAEILEPGHDRFEAMLRELAGYSQFTVRARYEEAQVLSEVVAENAEIAWLNDETRDQPEEPQYRALVRLGELVAAALEKKRAADAERMLSFFDPFVAALRVRDGAGIDQLVDVAFLVDRNQRAAFEQAAEQLASEYAGRARLKLVGPTAPYDFVDTGD